MKKLYILSVFFFLLLPIASIGAQEVDILWQGNNYVSPFYKGKNLWTRQSQLTLMAIPHGVGDRNTLVYRWIRNGTVLGSLSGPGKNSLTLNDTVLSKTVSVAVEIVETNDYESPILAQALVRLTPTNPTVAVYENNPIYGFLFQREIGQDHVIKGEEVTFAAFPLFFTVLDRSDSTLGYEWQTGGEKELNNSVTYRVPEGTSGSANVTMRVSNTEKIMQGASKTFLVQFRSE